MCRLKGKKRTITTEDGESPTWNRLFTASNVDAATDCVWFRKPAPEKIPQTDAIFVNVQARGTERRRARHTEDLHRHQGNRHSWRVFPQRSHVRRQAGEGPLPRHVSQSHTDSIRRFGDQPRESRYQSALDPFGHSKQISDFIIAFSLAPVHVTSPAPLCRCKSITRGACFFVLLEAYSTTGGKRGVICRTRKM